MALKQENRTRAVHRVASLRPHPRRATTGSASRRLSVLVCGLAAALAGPAVAGPVYQPPGVNLVLGDVTHGQRVQSASSNPAAAAADNARGIDKLTNGTILTASAGLEYGNVQDLFDFYDSIQGGYTPSPPPDGGEPPNELPPGHGIDFGAIWDSLDPQFKNTIEATARQVATQTALLAIISKQAYARAWLSADAPFVLGTEHLGGTWTFGANWAGTAKAFGVTESIEFNKEAARQAIREWWDGVAADRPVLLPVSDDVQLQINPITNAVIFAIQNDSSMVTKSTQTTNLHFGYSRPAWSNSSGTLYLGAKANAYLMRLSRLSVRFGDITDSKELFDAIRNNSYRTDERLGVDVGALWVADNYQVGLQVTNLNEPKFVFPEVDLTPYSSADIIDFLKRDRTYRMDSQVKLEASLFSHDRRWSAHLGLDADPATDPMGDRFQWATASAGWNNDSWWLPAVRLGYRENLAGTRMKYVGAGLTAFKYVNLDIASALHTVRIDGNTLPQGLMISLGFQFSW